MNNDGLNLHDQEFNQIQSQISENLQEITAINTDPPETLNVSGVSSPRPGFRNKKTASPEFLNKNNLPKIRDNVV